MASKAIAKNEVHLPEGLDIQALQADAQKHNVTMTSGDVALPYIYVLQSNSPQVNPGIPAYVDGAQAGMFYNNVSNTAYDGREAGIVLVPCHYERKLVEWVHRDDGGGWVRDHPIDSNILNKCSLDDKGKPRVGPNGTGNVIVETAYQYCLLLDAETGHWFQCVLPMKSTALKTNRRWNNSIVTTLIPGTEVQAPRWLYAYQLRTKIETKGENNWWGLEPTKFEQPVAREVYEAAKRFAELVSEGVVTRSIETDGADANHIDPAVDGGSEQIEGRANKKSDDELDDEIPF